MSPTTTGWTLFIAALGMMTGLLAVDIANLNDWSLATTPSFVGATMAHVAVVIGAFIGGKLIPESRTGIERTRATDPAPIREAK